MPPQVPALTDLIEVGRGGFGTVYRATDARFGRAVAVKVIRDAGLGRDVKARFERECLALGHLSGHPNIVAVHDSGATSEGELYLVMEYLGGGSFAQMLARDGASDPAMLAEWGAALAGALETAHRAGIIHRDVKPENVLMSDYGAPKLVDFGIARMRSAYQTRSGFVSATLNHAAPEVVAGAAVSEAADVYSLASVLYTMAAGRAPFDRGPEDSLAPMIARIAAADPPDLRRLGVPEAFATVVERGLAKDPAARYASSADLGFALAEVAAELGRGGAVVPFGDSGQLADARAELGTEPPLDPTPKPREIATLNVDRPHAATFEPQPEQDAARAWYRRPIAWAAAAVVLLLLAGGGTAFGLSRSGRHNVVQPPPTTPALTPSATSTPAPSATTSITTGGRRHHVGQTSQTFPPGVVTSSGVASSQTPTHHETTKPHVNATTKAGLSASASVNHAPTFDGDSVTTGEERAVSIPFSASDPDGQRVTVTKIAGPSWLDVSGSSVAGYVPWSAADDRQPSTYRVVLRVSDGQAQVTGSVSVTVQDTHLQLPDVQGQYKDDVLQPLVDVHTLGCSATEMEASKIWATSPAGGAIVTYGSYVTVYYVNNSDSSVQPCPGS